MKKVKLIVIIVLIAVALFISIFFLLNKQNSNITETKKIKLPSEAQFKTVKLVDAKTNYLNTVKIMGDTSKFIDLCESEKAFKGLCQKRKELKTYSKQRHFCHNIFNDFINNKNIKIIGPVVHTNDFNDKKLQSYWKKCPYFQQRLNVISSEALPMPNGIYDSCISSSEDWVKCTEGSYLPKSGAYGHFNYQLYNVDFDNNSKNGVQTLFYTGGSHYQIDDYIVSSNDIYSFIDFKNCKIIKKFKMNETIDFLTLKKTTTFNGVFKYKIDGRYYLYVLEGNPKYTNESQFLTFNVWKPSYLSGFKGFEFGLYSECDYSNE